MGLIKKITGEDGIRKGVASALFWKRFNLFLTFFWIVLFVVASLAEWTKSTVFVSDLSLIALVLASQSSWQASRVERKADERDPDTPTD